MTRRTIRVELDRYSARVTGPRLRPLLDRAGSRWHWDPYSHKAVSVHIADVNDLLVIAELGGCLIEVVDRDSRQVATGGLLGVT